MTKMRSIIAQRMVESKRTSPHVHTVFKVDMTRIVKLREKEKSKYEQRNGVKLTYMPFITRAAIVALRKHPDRQRLDRRRRDSLQQEHQHRHRGGARLGPDRAGHQAGGGEELPRHRARHRRPGRPRPRQEAAPDEISGGTFTLTNSGIFGEQFGTPIINQPQTAILGIGGLNKEAEVLTDKDGNDSIAIRSIQRFTLGFDHRIIDGADAGKFMSDFKAYLENWNEDIG